MFYNRQEFLKNHCKRPAKQLKQEITTWNILSVFAFFISSIRPFIQASRLPIPIRVSLLSGDILPLLQVKALWVVSTLNMGAVRLSEMLASIYNPEDVTFILYWWS